MEIARLIEEDLLVIEARGVLRETGDLMRIILPAFKKYITELPDSDSFFDEPLEPPPGWYDMPLTAVPMGMTSEEEARAVGVMEWGYDYTVPTYWKIPKLAGKKLRLVIAFYPLTVVSDFRLRGEAQPQELPVPQLILRAIVPIFHKSQFSKMQVDVKTVLTHELTHFKEDRPLVAYPSMSEIEAGDISYYAHPYEVRANIADMVATARRLRIPFLDVLRQTAEVWVDQYSKEDAEKLVQLYRQEYIDRYGAERWYKHFPKHQRSRYA